MTTVLALSAAAYGILMALAPLLQVSRMRRQRSSRDVSIGYFAILLPGFALWVAYGVVRSDWALIVPNLVAIVVGLTVIGVAAYLRSPRRNRPPTG